MEGTSCKYVLGRWHVVGDRFSSITCSIAFKGHRFEVWENWNPILKPTHYFLKWLNLETMPTATYFNRDIFQKKCQPQICLARCILCYFLSFSFSALASRTAWRMSSFRVFIRRKEKIESYLLLFLILFMSKSYASILKQIVFTGTLCVLVCVCTHARAGAGVGM